MNLNHLCCYHKYRLLEFWNKYICREKFICIWEIILTENNYELMHAFYDKINKKYLTRSSAHKMNKHIKLELLHKQILIGNDQDFLLEVTSILAIQMYIQILKLCYAYNYQLIKVNWDNEKILIIIINTWLHFWKIEETNSEI